jgi:hypothetical protein
MGGGLLSALRERVDFVMDSVCAKLMVEDRECVSDGV